MRAISLCLAVMAACTCSVRASAVLAEDRVQIVTTTTDLRSLVEAVGGDLVEAISLVPVAMDAEEYQPKPQDLLRLKNARLLVRVGLDYDLWLDRLLAQTDNPDVRRGSAGYVDASFGIPVLEVRGMSVGPNDGHAHGSGNPTTGSIPGTPRSSRARSWTLAQRDPANVPTYEANRLAFLARLERKLPVWETSLAPLKAMPLVAYHNSWPYFARRFRLDFVGFLETKPGVPPSPSHLAALLQTMRARAVRIVIQEPYQPERDAAFVAGKAGASVVTLAASVGALTQTDDFISLFERDVEALRAAASGQ